MICCAQPCQCVLSPPVKPTCIAGALQQINQHSRSVNSVDFYRLCCTARFYSSSRYTVWCTFCRPHLPKVPRACQLFRILTCKSSPHYSPVHFLSKTLPCQAPQPWKQILGDPTSHIYPRKTQGFHAGECFHPWIYAFHCRTALVLCC